MVRSRYFKITDHEMNFIGILDKTMFEVLNRASNEELSNMLHDGGYATFETWGKVVQAMLKRVCKERKYNPWSRKSTEPHIPGYTGDPPL